MFQNPQGAHRVVGIPVTDTTWRDQVIEGEDLGSMIFEGCNFERTRFVGTSLWQTMFINCRIEDCDFVGCKMLRTQINQCEISTIRLLEGDKEEKGELAEMNIASSDIEKLQVNQKGRQLAISESQVGQLSFNAAGTEQEALTMSGTTCGEVLAENARWTGATAVECDLRRWKIDGARFHRCTFIRINADEMDLSSVQFEMCNLYQASLKRTKIRTATTTIFAECDCEEADFEEAKLHNTLFSAINGVRARYARADLNQTMFPNATLHEADFSGAIARSSVWMGADLARTNLERIDASRSSWRNAKFEDTCVDGASFVESDLHGVDASLDGADTRGARRGIKWREDLEKKARDGTGPRT